MKDISLRIEVKKEVSKTKVVNGETVSYKVYEGCGDWKYADLSDADLTLEIVGVIMNDEKGGTYSYPFTLDVEENEHIFGSSGEVRGDSIYNRLNDARCQLMASGMPIVQGKISLDDSVDIKPKKNGHHEVELKVVSRNKSYEDKIEGAKLRDIDLLQHQIQIGYSLPSELYFGYTYTRTIDRYTGDAEDWNDDMLYTGSSQGSVPYERISSVVVSKNDRYVSLPHCLLPKYTDTKFGGLYSGDFVNTSEPYNPNDPLAHPYCNTRICYQKYVEADSDGDEKTWEKERGYSIGEADRINSAPCFYMGFVFDMAMQQMGISVTSNSLNDIMDYRRMAFWHADAQYDLVSVTDRGVGFDQDACNMFKISADYAGGQQHAGNNVYKFVFNGNIYRYIYNFVDEDGKDSRKIRPMYYLKKAYANADNLPDIEVKDLIENMTSAFGARVIYDEFMGSISIILLRDVMRDSNNAINVPCEMLSAYKTEEDKRGFVLKYSGANTQSFNSITKAKNDSEGGDETQYNYYGYKNIKMLQDGEEYPSFKNLTLGVSCYDMNLYIDTTTGNMYRVKVDSSADNQGAWYPSTFEVAGYRDVELGDCSDDDFVESVSIPFAPAIASIVNQTDMRQAMQAGSDVPSPIYAQFIDGEIHNTGELIEHVYTYPGIPLDSILDDNGKTINACHIDVNVTIKSFEEYTGSDAPYFDNECENVIGIMRGSGSDAGIVYYGQNYDGFGTEKYMLTAGSDAEFFSDSVNHFGQMFDYDGDAGTTVNITPSEVPAKLRLYFGESNANLISPSRKVSGDAVRAKGWDVEGDYCTVLSRTYTYLGMDYLFTPIMDDGTILTMAELDAYFDKVKMAAAVTTNDIVVTADKNNKKLFIGRYATSNNDHTESDTFAILLHELHEVYYGNQDGTITFPENGLGYLPSDAISLKLKAEKPKDGDETTGEYYDINPTFAKRGLWDKFYVDWAHFWLNHHIANLTMRLELAAFSQIALDTTKWYTFGEYTGLIKNGTAKLLDGGMVEIDLELAYL